MANIDYEDIIEYYEIGCNDCNTYDYIKDSVKDYISFHKELQSLNKKQITKICKELMEMCL